MVSQPVPRPCSIASSLDVMGERWSLLILREIHYGVRRFDEIIQNTGASRDTVAKRLKSLTEAGVIERRQYSANPPRFEYHATPAGIELRPILMLLNEWGHKWLPDSPQTRERLIHACGAELELQVSCLHCGQALDSNDIVMESDSAA